MNSLFYMMYIKKTCVQSVSFVQWTDQKSKILYLLSLNTKKTIKSSRLSGWNQEMFDISAKRLKQFINYENIRSFAR